MCLQTCAVVTYSKDWMSWKVLSEGIIFSVYRITLTETGVKEAPQFIAWYPNIVTHELMSEYMDCDRFFHTVLNKIGCSRSETQQLRDNSAVFLVTRGHWQSPPEEQRLSSSYPCIKIEGDKDTAWVPTAFISGHWVTSELCSLFQGKGLTGRKQAGAAENRARCRKISCSKEEDLAAGEILSE